MTIIGKGTGYWSGWSYPWMSLIASRLGRGEMAWKMLQDYFYFIMSNTLHIHADAKKFGIEHITVLSMTLEGGFAYAAAILEMLLQSYNGIVRVFPAVPYLWVDVSFEYLLAEGCFLVSAERINGSVKWIRIKANIKSKLRIKNVFEGEIFLNGKKKIRKSDIITIEMKAGQIIELSVKNYKRKVNNKKLITTKSYFGLKRKPVF